MAESNQDPKKILNENKLLKEQIKLLQDRQKLQEESFDISAASLDSLKEMLGIQSRSSTFEKAILKTNQDINSSILNQKTGLSGLSTIQRQIQKNQDLLKKSKLIESSLEKQIGGTLSKKGQAVSNAISQQKNLNNQLENSQNLTADEYKLILDQIASNDHVISQNLKKLSTTEQQLILTQQNTSELIKQQKVRKSEESIQKKLESRLGLAGNLSKTLGAIPGIGRSSAESLSEVTEELQKQVEETGKLPSRWKTFSMLVGKTANSLSKGLTDPVTIITGLVGLMKDLDGGAEDFARSMNMTYTEALKVRNEMSAVAGISKGQLLESTSFINQQLGSSAQLTEENVAAFTKLRINVGLTGDELMGITNLTLTNGKNIKQNTNEFISQAKSIAANNKVVLNEKQLLKEVGKISAATTLSLGKNPKELARAVATAKALGMEMSKLEDIAGGLLDFESSIENELSAELLTGKELNLERARQLALNNDIAGMAEEINKQIGSSADYTKMNRIQQEALAKSVGMNREELAQTLYTQEQLRGLSGEEASNRQALLDQRIEEVGLVQAKKELEEGGFEALNEQAGVQTKFNQMMIELKDTLANGILPLFLPMADFLTKNVGLVKTILGTYLAIKGVMLAANAIQAVGILLGKKKAADEKRGLIRSIGDASMKAISSLASIPIVGWALGLAAAGTVAALGYSFMKGDDVMSPGGSGNGYGSRTLLGPEGAIQLNDKDTVIAGTNLFDKADDMVSAPKGTIKASSGNDMSSVVQAIAELRTAVNQLASRPINVAIDGEKVIKATTGNNPNTDGDEMRKNSYKIQ